MSSGVFISIFGILFLALPKTITKLSSDTGAKQYMKEASN